MAQKTHAEVRYETVNKREGLGNLIITLPFDTRPLLLALRNCPRDKKSVTLIDAALCGAVNSRGSEPLYVNIGDYRVELKGGVNAYCSLPSGAGTAIGQDSARMDAEAARKAAEERAAEAMDWTVLKGPLMSKDGKDILRQEGDRIRKDSLADLLLAGCYVEELTVPAIVESKHPVLSDEEHSAIVNQALDSKMAELENAFSEGTLVE